MKFKKKPPKRPLRFKKQFGKPQGICSVCGEVVHLRKRTAAGREKLTAADNPGAEVIDSHEHKGLPCNGTGQVPAI